jgi:TetR/AcrR family acrAB operon transcriptional repressor
MARRTAADTAATRQALLDAALGVFGESGFAAARLEDIARRAGVTRGALYHHFADKAAVYDAVLRDAADSVMAPLFAELTGDDPPLERLARFLASYCDALTADADFRAVLRLLLFDVADPPITSRETTSRGVQAWLAAFEAATRDAADRGELRPSVSPGTAALLVLTLAIGTTTTAVQAPVLPAVADLAGPLVDALLHGIAA